MTQFIDSMIKFFESLFEEPSKTLTEEAVTTMPVRTPQLDVEALTEQLRRHEGVEKHVYKDSVGIETIGVGRNLVDKGLTDDEIDYLLANDIRDAEEDCKAVFDFYDQLSGIRKRVLVDMAFNLGRTRLSKFIKMAAALEVKDYDEAAKQMLQSKWATQVGIRAVRLAQMMRTNEISRI